ncbi:SAF domain-containing protein [Amycolatopsis sp. NPDC059657]|uniref:SAF domain-containing protein n=1 Tax=Amycolatopsis sp. NPDC059657 TaxID=3346899 RepID=UPI00366DDEA4
MTITDSAPRTSTSSPAPSTEEPEEKKYGPMMHVAAAAIAAIVAVPIIWVVSLLHDKTIPVLVLARDVGAIQKIAEQDLTTVELEPDHGVRFVRSADRADVLGHSLATGLAKGTILTISDLASDWSAGPGAHVVGLLATGAQRPAQPLRSGALVCVWLPSAKAPCGGDGSFQARVAEVGRPDRDGSMVVDVIVSSAHLEQALAASGGNALISLIGA